MVLPEDRSAFSYEDTISHLVGIRVAGEALRDEMRDFDEAMTHALNAGLRRLHVVPVNQAEEAVRQVEGTWWAAGTPIRRYLDIGIENRILKPWLVSDFCMCESREAERFPIPSVDQVMGYDFSGFCQVEIDPYVLEASEITSMFSPRPKRIRPDTHFTRIMEQIREEMVRAMGPGVDQPD